MARKGLYSKQFAKHAKRKEEDAHPFRKGRGGLGARRRTAQRSVDRSFGGERKRDVAHAPSQRGSKFGGEVSSAAAFVSPASWGR